MLQVEPGSSPHARRVLWLLMAGASGLMLFLAWPFRVPLFLGAVLAVALQPLLRRAERLCGGRRRLAGSLLTVAVIVAIIVPVGAILSVLFTELRGGIAYLHNQLGVQAVSPLSAPPVFDPTHLRLDVALRWAHVNPLDFQAYASRVLALAEAQMPSALIESGRAAFNTVVMVTAFYFLLIDGRRVIARLRWISPFDAAQTHGLIDAFRKVTSSTIATLAVTGLVQGSAASVGFALAQTPHAIFFGMLTAMASFVPVVGTTLIWAPAVAQLALAGKPGPALFLGAWCLVFVVGVEHVARPLLLKGHSEAHSGLLFLGLVGGIETFGLVGIIAGPLVVALFIAVFQLYARDFGDAAESDAAS